MTEALGQPRLITLHWTAGSHTQTFPDYHFCVRGDGQVVQTLPIGIKGSHTWGRNTGNIGISLCAMAKGYPVTAAQRESTAVLVAELAGCYGIDLHATIQLPELRLSPDGKRLIPTGRLRPFPALADHAVFARADGYFPDRWDIGDEFPRIRDRAWAVRADLQHGRRRNGMQGNIR
jgi:hypothetical protein